MLHGAESSLAAEHRSLEADAVDLFQQSVGVLLLVGTFGQLRAHVVDPAVDGAELFHNMIGKGVDALFLGHVHYFGVNGAQTAEFLLRLTQMALGHRADGDLGALLQQQSGSRQADSLAGAGNNDDFVFQTQIHFSLPPVFFPIGGA